MSNKEELAARLEKFEAAYKKEIEELRADIQAIQEPEAKTEWPWKPKEGEQFYCIISSGETDLYYSETVKRKKAIQRNNCFQTEDEAQEYSAFLKDESLRHRAQFELKKALDQLNDGWKPDRSDDYGYHLAAKPSGLTIVTSIFQQVPKWMYIKGGLELSSITDLVPENIIKLALGVE